MKKILWLASWYPSKEKPFNGDFIQRQARAVALFNHVHVVYVEKVEGSDRHTNEWKKTGNLTEEIIYNHASKIPFLGKLVSLRRYYRLNKTAIKNYIETNGMPDVVHVQIPIKAGIVALWLKRKFNIPFVLTEHYGIYNRVVVDPFEDRSSLFKHYTKKIIEAASFFLPVSKQIGDTINEVVTRKTFEAIPNTVDTQLFRFKDSPSTTFRFLHVSNMIPLKNVEGIIDAVEKLWQQRQDFEMLIVGPATEIVKAYAQRSPLLNKVFRFAGEVPYQQVAQEMQQANAVVLFSRTENMPCVILESLCSGRPVIATKVGGIPEVVHDRNGILVESDNVDMLVEAMQSMINDHKRFELPAIAEEASSLYSYEAIGQKISNVYARVESESREVRKSERRL